MLVDSQEVNHAATSVTSPALDVLGKNGSAPHQGNSELMSTPGLRRNGLVVVSCKSRRLFRLLAEALPALHATWRRSHALLGCPRVCAGCCA